MPISPKNVSFKRDCMWVELTDGRTLDVPLAWFPRLMNAPIDELMQWELTPLGIHWDSLNEDLSIDGLLKGLDQ